MKKFTFSIWRQSIVFILFILLSGQQTFAQQDTIEKYYATHTSATWCANPDSLHDKGLYRESIESLKKDTLIKNFVRYYQLAADYVMLDELDSTFFYLNRFVETSPDDRVIYVDQRFEGLPKSDSIQWKMLTDKIVALYFESVGPVKDSALAQELFYLSALDQKYRLYRSVLWQIPNDSAEYAEADNEMYYLFKRTKEIYEKYGFPGISLVGKSASAGAFYLLQHSPYINKFYPLIKKAYRNNDIAPVYYAMVTDRLLLEKGRRQLYGSQCVRSTKTEKYFQDNTILWPVKDFKNVNERRKAMGFTNTVEENTKRLNAIIPPEYYEGKEKMKWVRRW